MPGIDDHPSATSTNMAKVIRNEPTYRSTSAEDIFMLGLVTLTSRFFA